MATATRGFPLPLFMDPADSGLELKARVFDFMAGM